MSYRLKNSDFKPFLGIFDGKVSDLLVYVGEGIGVYFWIFLCYDLFARQNIKKNLLTRSLYEE